MPQPPVEIQCDQLGAGLEGQQGRPADAQLQRVAGEVAAVGPEGRLEAHETARRDRVGGHEQEERVVDGGGAGARGHHRVGDRPVGGPDPHALVQGDQRGHEVRGRGLPAAVAQAQQQAGGVAGIERALDERVALDAHVRPGDGRDRVAVAQVRVGQRDDARGRGPEPVGRGADLRRPGEDARLGQRVAVAPVVEVAVRGVQRPPARPRQVGRAQRGLVVPLVEGRRVGRGPRHVAPGVQVVVAVGVERDPGGGPERGDEVALRRGLGLGEGARPAVGLGRGERARAVVVVVPREAEVAVEVHAVHGLEADAVGVVVAPVLAPHAAAVGVGGLVVGVAVGVGHRADVDVAPLEQVAGELVGVVPRQQVVHEPEDRLHPHRLTGVDEGVEEHGRVPTRGDGLAPQPEPPDRAALPRDAQRVELVGDHAIGVLAGDEGIELHLHLVERPEPAHAARAEGRQRLGADHARPGASRSSPAPVRAAAAAPARGPRARRSAARPRRRARRSSRRPRSAAPRPRAGPARPPTRRPGGRCRSRRPAATRA